MWVFLKLFLSGRGKGGYFGQHGYATVPCTCVVFGCCVTRFYANPQDFWPSLLLFRGTTFSPTDRGIRDVAQQLKSMNLIPDTKARKRKACMYKMYTVGTTSVCTVTHACIAYTCTHIHTHAHTCAHMHCVYMYTHSHTCTHMHTHVHTCIAYTMHSCVYVSVQHVCYYMYVYTASEIAYNKVLYASCRRFWVCLLCLYFHCNHLCL